MTEVEVTGGRGPQLLLDLLLIVTYYHTLAEAFTLRHSCYHLIMTQRFHQRLQTLWPIIPQLLLKQFNHPPRETQKLAMDLQKSLHNGLQLAFYLYFPIRRSIN